ncbi:MAG: glycosyltransferase family 39 protein, partial [Pseudomonadota bacterium]
MKSENNPRDKAFPHKSQSSPPSLVARLFPFLGLLLTVAVTAWVFLQVRGFDFINYDDPLYVTQNPQVLAGWTMEGLRWAFTAWHASNWHPLTWLSLMTDVELFGPGAGALHAVSAGLHLANVLLVYLAVFSLTGRRGAALLTAALFGVHPLHVESVAWISERKDVLSCFFSLLAIIAYTRYARSGRFREYVASLALFAAALLAKPMAVTLPLVLLLLDAWPLGRIQANPRQVLK